MSIYFEAVPITKVNSKKALTEEKIALEKAIKISVEHWGKNRVTWVVYEQRLEVVNKLLAQYPSCESCHDEPSQKWLNENKGNIEYTCEFCGIYAANKPRCNKCEVDN